MRYARRTTVRGFRNPESRISNHVSRISYVSRVTRHGGYDMKTHLLRLILLFILSTSFVLAKAS